MKMNFTHSRTHALTNSLTHRHLAFYGSICLPMSPHMHFGANRLQRYRKFGPGGFKIFWKIWLWDQGKLWPWEFVTMAHCDIVFLGLRDHGTLKLWDLGIMGIWGYGTLRQLNSGRMELWENGTLGQWNFGTMKLWDNETLGQWNFGTMEPFKVFQ